jgi:hypothetical protein
MRSRRSAALAVVVVAIALIGLVAACGSGGGPTTFTSKDYKFQLTYDSSALTQSTSLSSAGAAGGKSVFDVGFVNPKGTKSSGEYRDGLVISVYKLNATVTDAMLPAVKSELEGILPQLQQSLGSDAKLGSLSAVDLNGIKGFSSDATFTLDKIPFKATLYFLINGNLEYQVTAQAAESKWTTMQSVFKTTMDSFKATQ